MAVVKADAYGHGAVEVCRTLSAEGVTFFCVAHAHEAEPLRAAGIDAPILVFQPDFLWDREIYQRLSLDVCLSSPEEIAAFDGMVGPPLRAHLFVDTGMGREGVLADEVPLCRERLEAQSALEWFGLMTHFAGADLQDLSSARKQLAVFEAVMAEIPPQQRDGLLVHAACSGAVINLPGSRFDMVRPGILLYGQYGGSGVVDQKPVMRVWASLQLIKQVPEDYAIGYGGTYRTSTATTIGYLGLGYADGFLRQKTESSRIWIDGKPYPVVGRVSMDQIAVDLGPHCKFRVGTEVEIFREFGEGSIIDDARLRGTISYERCVQLAMRLPKVYL